MSECIFCNIINGKIPVDKLYEDEMLIAIKDINPQSPVHILLIPKLHIPTSLDITQEHKDMIFKIISVANNLAKATNISNHGFRIVLNCLEQGGQSVFHLHFHLLGGRAMKWPPG